MGDSDRLRVAVDVGPLHGPRTGIGTAVDGTLAALGRFRGDVELWPYLISMRARTPGAVRRLPLPAMVAHRIWSRMSGPPMDVFLSQVRERPDVVHGTNYVVPPTTAAIARLVSVYDCWFLDHPGDAHPDVRRAGEVLRRSLDDGAHVVASSAATADALIERIAGLERERVSVVHLGPPEAPSFDDADPSADGRQQADGPSMVLALGTVERRKNLPALVEAFGRLAAEVAHVELVVAGGAGDDSERLDRAIGQLDDGARRRVRVVGRVDGAERERLLSTATVLAYPSLDEGFGFPILEAQQRGVPVVATAVGSIPEVGGPSLLLSRPDDVLALAANLHAVVTDPSRRADLAERGHRNVERFSWQRCADEMARLYRDLARGGDGGGTGEAA